MKFPITINKIKYSGGITIQKKGLTAECGDFVKVRPCGEKYKNKTYLGIYLGDSPVGQSVTFDKEDASITVSAVIGNPTILIPEINDIVYGCGSWWEKIKNEKDLKEITDETINNQWYVKAAQQTFTKMENKNGN